MKAFFTSSGFCSMSPICHHAFSIKAFCGQIRRGTKMEPRENQPQTLAELGFSGVAVYGVACIVPSAQRTSSSYNILIPSPSPRAREMKVP